MHESKLVTDLVRKANSVAATSGSGSVETMSIEIGALNHATPESLRDHLQDAAAGTALEGAVFEIEKSSDTDSTTALDVRLVSLTVRES